MYDLMFAEYMKMKAFDFLRWYKNLWIKTINWMKETTIIFFQEMKKMYLEDLPSEINAKEKEQTIHNNSKETKLVVKDELNNNHNRQVNIKPTKKYISVCKVLRHYAQILISKFTN